MNEQNKGGIAFPEAPASVPKQPTLISDEILYKLAAAHAQLTQLMETKVPEDQVGVIAHHTEFKLLTEQISAVFLAHANEFLGAIFILKQQHIPLVRALIPVIHQAMQVAESRAPISEAAQAEAVTKE